MDIDSGAPGVRSPLSSTSGAGPSPATVAGDDEAPLVLITYRCTVRAVHRLWCSALSEQQNQARWGLPGMAVHGHTYTFEVKFKAPVSRKTGQVLSSDILEESVHMGVHEVLHHKNLDADVSFFLSRPSTLENVCLFAWRNIGVLVAHTGRQVHEVSVEAEPCPRGEPLSIERTRVSFSGELGPLTI